LLSVARKDSGEELGVLLFLAVLILSSFDNTLPYPLFRYVILHKIPFTY